MPDGLGSGGDAGAPGVPKIRSIAGNIECTGAGSERDNGNDNSQYVNCTIFEMSDYILYSYFRSSCSARLRIVLNLKSIPYDLVPVNLLKNEHVSDEHRALNPSGSVPVLVSKKDGDEPFKICQSVAALEYLEEQHPEVPTLPSDAKGRAVVRTLVNIVAADIQPVTNLRIMRRVRELGAKAEDWNQQLMSDGLRAYETIAEKSAGKYSFGDQITIADACLLPAVWNAERFGVDLSLFPTVKKITENLMSHPAVIAAYYFNQPDTPEELRTKQ